MANTSSTKTKRSKRPQKSPEERAAEAQALHDTLTAQVEELANSETWTRYLDFLGSFHAYSFNNLMLIFAQRPDATMVAGFRQWQAKGRQVRKGERSIKIRGFSTKKVTATDPDTGDDVDQLLKRFPILSVFDITQTDPIPDPDGETVDHTNPAQLLTGDDPDGIYDRMHTHLTSLGWTITREHARGANGYTTTDGTQRIVIDHAPQPAQAAKTLLHEAGHAILHAGLDRGDYVAHRGLYECEAESVAYVLAGLAGLDTSTYSVGYVTAWTGGNTDTLRDTATNVLAAVHQLAPALLDHDDTAADDTAADDTATEA